MSSLIRSEIINNCYNNNVYFTSARLGTSVNNVNYTAILKVDVTCPYANIVPLYPDKTLQRV
jgi:hypothetical protein